MPNVPIVFADAHVAAETGQAGRCDAPVLAEQLDRGVRQTKALPPGLTLDKPCPARPVTPPLNRRTTP